MISLSNPRPWNLVSRSDINGNRTVTFDRKWRSLPRFDQKENYQCMLSDKVPMPKFSKGVCDNRNNTVTFTHYTSPNQVAPYNKYYQGSEIVFNHMLDALSHCIPGQAITYHGIHLYYEYYRHTYTMPILFRGDGFVRTRTTKVVI